MKNKIRILHVETGMNLYGGALQVHYLLRGLKDLGGTENILVAPSGSRIIHACSDSARTREVPMKGDLDLGFTFRLAKIIRKETPDIVHLHSRRGADVLGGIAARMTGTKCILTRRVDNPEPSLWVSLKYRLFDVVITISDGITEVLEKRGVPREKLTMVHSAVDAARFDVPAERKWFREEFGLSENVCACGTIAQFIHRKGHADLLTAIPRILKEIPGARFLLFGKGPLGDELRKRVKDLKVEDKVVFAGFREDLERILPCLDILIHPALMEGLGVSLLQAAAAGVPVVGTRAGGIPEAVEDGVTGLLIQPGNPETIAEAAVRILSDPLLAKKMGEEGKKRVAERFSIEAMARGNLEVYSEIIDAKRKRELRIEKGEMGRQKSNPAQASFYLRSSTF